MTIDVYTAVTTQLCLNKFATALFLLLSIREDSANHFMHSLCMTCKGKLFVKITNCDLTETQGGRMETLFLHSKYIYIGKHKEQIG